MKLKSPHLYWDFCMRDFPRGECEVAWVVNDTADLKWAVRNRRRLEAAELWAGPNIVVVPQEADAILTSDQIDRIIVPTKWVADVYADAYPQLRSRISIWPAAIDADYWSPEGEPRTHWLIYNKNEDGLAAEITRALAKLAVNFAQINYGQYSEAEFKNRLNTALGLIWLSRSESQGIALLEAFSMDVPALVWDRGYWEYESRELKRKFVAPATSAPYFSEACGYRFTDAIDFEAAFERFRENAPRYHPRQYIMSSGLDLRSNKDRIAGLIRETRSEIA
jgi:hypothetical protein